MGLVLEFGARTVKPGRVRPTQPCEITIFPGVRYERHDMVPARDPDRKPSWTSRPNDESRR